MIGLLLLGVLAAGGARRHACLEVAWPDECIYLVGARNLVEHGTLDTHYYLTYSILLRGHPHRDVHMPGYVLALGPFVKAFGATLTAGATLNVALFLACILLVYGIGRALLEEPAQAAAAAALFAVMPPITGYLYVVYPELLVTFLLLAGVAWLVRGGGLVHATIAGILFAAGALARETSLLALPLYLVRLGRRELWRGFVPAALATLLLVVAPLAHDRAVHPNAIYPGIVEEARRSEAPLRTLGAALLHNVQVNLGLAATLDPLRSEEDAALLVLLVLAAASSLGALRLAREARRLAAASYVSLGLLSAAVLTLYVVRERGGVWGGVRVYMSWAPLLLLFLAAWLVRSARPLRSAVAVAAVAALFLSLGARQMAFLAHYKASDLEDQSRNERYLARYLDRYHPARILSRSFTYGLSHYPVEVIWQLPQDRKELQALEQAIAFDFVAVHEKSDIRLALLDNPRYLRVNRDDRGAEFLIWRRLY